MKKTAIIVALLIASFVGAGAILPALAKVRDFGAMPGTFVPTYTLGVFLLTIAGFGTLSFYVRKRKPD